MSNLASSQLEFKSLASRWGSARPLREVSKLSLSSIRSAKTATVRFGFGPLWSKAFEESTDRVKVSFAIDPVRSRYCRRVVDCQ
eukprot:3938460-Rhodomonas_salina.1